MPSLLLLLLLVFFLPQPNVVTPLLAPANVIVMRSKRTKKRRRKRLILVRKGDQVSPRPRHCHHRRHRHRQHVFLPHVMNPRQFHLPVHPQPKPLRKQLRPKGEAPKDKSLHVSLARPRPLNLPPRRKRTRRTTKMKIC